MRGVGEKATFPVHGMPQARQEVVEAEHERSDFRRHIVDGQRRKVPVVPAGDRGGKAIHSSKGDAHDQFADQGDERERQDERQRGAESRLLRKFLPDDGLLGDLHGPIALHQGIHPPGRPLVVEVGEPRSGRLGELRSRRRGPLQPDRGLPNGDDVVVLRIMRCQGKVGAVLLRKISDEACDLHLLEIEELVGLGHRREIGGGTPTTARADSTPRSERDDRALERLIPGEPSSRHRGRCG